MPVSAAIEEKPACLCPASRRLFHLLLTLHTLPLSPKPHMDDPEAEIAHAINLVAAAASADAQLAAIEKYFTPDASFLHPLCYVPPSAQSRARIALIYRCYRGFVSRTIFEFQAVAWNKASGTLFVSLIQRPEIRVLRWFFIPELPMRIYLHLRKDDTGYRIDRQEDLVQPRSVLMSGPMTQWLGILLWWLCQMTGIVSAYVFAALGVWSPKSGSKLS